MTQRGIGLSAPGTRSGRVGRRLVAGIGLGAVIALVITVAMIVVDHGSAAPVANAVCPGDARSASAEWAPTHTDIDAPNDRHPFAGNGYLGLRVPPRGMGYAANGDKNGRPQYDGAFVAGLFAVSPSADEGREVIAALPNWSTLTVDVGGEQYDASTAATRISNFAQTVHLRCGLVRTTLTWTAANGKATDLVYEVLADRSDQHAGAVHLTLVPHWSGDITVTDVLDGAGARRITRTGTDAPGDDSVRVEFRTEGTAVAGSVASVLRTDTSATVRSAPGRDLTVAQAARFPVVAGNTYEVTKFVGVDTALTAADPAESAFAAAWRAAFKGWPRLLASTAAAWRDLWAGDIELPGRADLQRSARAALYSLYANTAARQDNSISPVGLGSDEYAGQIRGEAERSMLPALLQFVPESARSLLEYRFRTLPAAKANARRLGLRGALYPLTSGSRGDLDECRGWAPPRCLTQIHLQGDISLAVWRYYLATGDKHQLRTRGWPIMQSIAEFFASRVTPNPDGSFSLENVAGPDENSNGVNDGVYTNAVAALALRNAAQAAEALGERFPAEWRTIADHVRMPFDPAGNVFPQYDGYAGAPIEQADAVLLVYPLEWPIPQDVSADLRQYYAARTDPDGPATTDGMHAVAAAAVGAPGCVTAAFLERAVRPLARAPYGRPAAAGAFVQAVTNGLLGLRWRADEVELDPVLPAELGTAPHLRGMQWHGRTFDAELGQDSTTITLKTGAPMRVRTPAGVQEVGKGSTLTVPTRRPDRTGNLARCKQVSSSSDEAGSYAGAAIDGSAATSWAPDGPQGNLTVDLGGPTRIGRVLPHWASAAPITSTVQISGDNRTWTTVLVDKVTGALPTPTVTRYVQLDVTATDPTTRPAVRELEIGGEQ
ncbi:discoidin domain-containing protein [Nocardia sp. NPDC049149]|uniref:discoidin domain-containing protein n=1 Tax=Nocardia sp. NPDC049149 TaxID=3364315 RepID=UPI0037200353